MKRYEKYKPSGIDWIGDVPDHWAVNRVKLYFSIISGSGFKLELQGEETGDYPVCKASDISAADYKIQTAVNYISKSTAKEAGFSVIPKGSVLFAKIGEAMRKNNRAIADVDCCVDNNCQGMVPKDINPFFGYYLFRCIDMGWFDNGGTIPCINNQKLLNSRIPMPSTNEQASIVAYLDARCGDIDKVVATQEKRIALLKELKQSVITQAVTSGLNPDVKMKDSGVEWIGEVPEHWEVMPFKSKFKTDKGLSITKADLVDEGVPVISYGQIHSKQNDYVHTLDQLLRFIPEELIPTDSKAKVEVGDIVFADTSEDVDGSGNAFYIERTGIYAGYHTVIAKSIERTDNKYLAYLFTTPMWRSQVRSQVYGVKVYSITQQILKSTSLIVPPVEEQKRIVEALEEKCAKIDKQIGNIQSQIDLLREYKQSLITEVVTGKRKVC